MLNKKKRDLNQKKSFEAEKAYILKLNNVETEITSNDSLSLIYFHILFSTQLHCAISYVLFVFTIKVELKCLALCVMRHLMVKKIKT